MSIDTDIPTEFFDLLNRYPSPHNGQPIRVKLTGETTFGLYFVKERGLQATDISLIFSFVSMGVFVEYMRLAAQAQGHEVQIELSLPREDRLRGKGLVQFASGEIAWNAGIPDLEMQKALEFRQTSRKKYTADMSVGLADALDDIAASADMKLAALNKSQTRQAIWLNQRAVFDDLFDEPSRKELDHWLRYSRREKNVKMDGLAYDCMQLNGWLMKYIVAHPRILRLPVLSYLIKQYYLRTMTDESTVLYLMAPFDNEDDSYRVGTVVTKLWSEVARQGYYLHPFGTIMSNHKAHQDFLRLAEESDESRESSYLVFIFRCGKSEPPVPSLRLPVDEHLLIKEKPHV
jgi:hypothetical protein